MLMCCAAVCVTQRKRGGQPEPAVCIGSLSVSLDNKTWTVVHQGVLGSLDTRDGMFPISPSTPVVVEE